MVHQSDLASHEKRQAALSSLLAAVLLTSLKLCVGFYTNSLGILSEAAHSAFDLLAAGLTLFAIRYSSLPPDADHPYGHGKMENLSALLESLLLMLTCCWILWEAVDRLFFSPVSVSPSLWAVGIMVASIIIDASRARLLKRIALKHRSQALEADALHFSSDILSSTVVLFGLAALYLARLFPEKSKFRFLLEQADAAAALAVAAIILRISWSLGKKAALILLDTDAREDSFRIRKALKQVQGIQKIRSVKVRQSGPDMLVELILEVETSLLIGETKQLRSIIEEAVRTVSEHAQLTVIFEPAALPPQSRTAMVRETAAAHGLITHAIEFLSIQEPETKYITELFAVHIELPPDLPLAAAWAKTEKFRKDMQKQYPQASTILRLEPLSRETIGTLSAATDELLLQAKLKAVLEQEKTVGHPQDILIRADGSGGRYISFSCQMKAETTIRETHLTVLRLQSALLAKLPLLSQVRIQIKPEEQEQKE